MEYTKNRTENPSNINEISALITGKTIIGVVEIGKELQLSLSDDYLVRIIGTDVNLIKITNPSDKKLWENKYSISGLKRWIIQDPYFNL